MIKGTGSGFLFSISCFASSDETVESKMFTTLNLKNNSVYSSLSHCMRET